jgi:hypothetical protein
MPQTVDQALELIRENRPESVSLVRYRTTMDRLNADEFQPANAIVIVLGLIAALFGIILAVYLIYTARML